MVTLRPAVLSCARRFARRGPVGRMLRDLWLTCRFVGEVAGGAGRRGALSTSTVAGSGR